MVLPSGSESWQLRVCVYSAIAVTPATINIVFKCKPTSDDKGTPIVSPKKPKVLPPSEKDINAL